MVDTEQDQAGEEEDRGGDHEEDIEDGEGGLVDDRVSHVDLPGVMGRRWGGHKHNECFILLITTLV